MLVVLYAALSLVVAYTYFFRKTYPGFGTMALGLPLLTAGMFVRFYQPLGETWSLFWANVMLLAQPLLLYMGLARYGRITDWRRRSLTSGVLYGLILVLIAYYLFRDADTCRRVFLYSGFSAYIYSRIALEPFVDKRWRTYATQGVLSALYALFAVVFAVRAWGAWSAVACPVDELTQANAPLLASILLLSPLLVFCLLAMTSSRIEQELRRARDALRHDALTDPLTGLPNRRHFLRLARATLGRAKREGRKVSLIMLDLDHFKRINDTHGHQAGDVVLREAAQALRKVLRAGDAVGRLGGEEFGVLLSGVDGRQALDMAGRLRRAVAAIRPAGLRVTASLGVADGGYDLDSLLAKADKYLYAAKGAGRNRIMDRDGLDADATEAGA